MAESYSVKAILSAADRGFSSTINKAISTTETLASRIKSGFSFGVLTGMGQQAFSALTSGATELVGEINNSNKAWKTFESNMKILGKGEKDINDVKNALQDYAQESIYSSSDMASTYAQLASVGIDSADQLVMAFGGLAAAAENPAQAMKTLSQQAVQMAAKPNVAWADFKLMLEQSPAGIAEVAKRMGMSTSELVTKVQKGTVKTKDFFNAIKEAGGEGTEFEKLSKTYKGVDDAMDGLKETLGNKLTPAFEVLSGVAIGGIEGIITQVGKIDAEALAAKVTAGIEKAKPYWEAFKDICGQVGEALKVVGTFLMDNADTIAKVLPYIAGAALAFKAFKIINTIVPGMQLFTSSLGKLAGKGIAALAGKLFGIAAGETAAGTAAKTSGKQMLTMAKSTALLAVSVLLIAAGFALMAQSSIALANAGGLAIGVMVGMVAAVALLAVGAAALGTALTAGAVGFVAFGAALLLAGVAAVLAATSLTIIASVLPTIATYGMQGATSIAALGTSMMVFAAGAILAGASMTVLSAGLIALAAGVVVASVGMVAFGAAMVAGAAGTLLMVAALMGVQSSMTAIASKAKTSGQKLGQGFTEGMATRLAKAPAVAKRGTTTANAALMSGRAGAYRAGAYISMGFAQGMLSQLAIIRSAATQMAAAADAAVRAKAKIKSPSRVADGLGAYWGEGFANGILSMAKDAWNAAETLVSFPAVNTPNLAMAYGGELSADYSYSRNGVYSFEIPVIAEGREIARATATYMQEELDRYQTRNARKMGRV